MTSDVADARLTGKLRERGQRVTPQRLVIHRVLTARDQHISAEEMHATVSGRLPGTSLPTVYATLELFEELGLVRRVRTGSGAARFCSRTAPHGHAVCRECGAMFDLDDARPPEGVVESARRDGFVPDQAELVVWGRCADCA
jgi:Fe2+ or Zn2+ uptake regulation protein